MTQRKERAHNKGLANLFSCGSETRGTYCGVESGPEDGTEPSISQLLTEGERVGVCEHSAREEVTKHLGEHR